MDRLKLFSKTPMCSKLISGNLGSLLAQVNDTNLHQESKTGNGLGRELLQTTASRRHSEAVNCLSVKAILLLAGRSRRFWPLQEKSLFPIAGKTLLEHQVASLTQAGFKDILFVGGDHNLRQIKKMFPKVPVVEQENLELCMQGALLSALPKLKDEPVLIVGGNDVIDP